MVGYNQISVAPEDQEKTTFTCTCTYFSFKRMPFGLCNAPTFSASHNVYIFGYDGGHNSYIFGCLICGWFSFDDCFVQLVQALK